MRNSIFSKFKTKKRAIAEVEVEGHQHFKRNSNHNNNYHNHNHNQRNRRLSIYRQESSHVSKRINQPAIFKHRIKNENK